MDFIKTMLKLVGAFAIITFIACEWFIINCMNFIFTAIRVCLQLAVNFYPVTIIAVIIAIIVHKHKRIS